MMNLEKLLERHKDYICESDAKELFPEWRQTDDKEKALKKIMKRDDKKFLELVVVACIRETRDVLDKLLTRIYEEYLTTEDKELIEEFDRVVKRYSWAAKLCDEICWMRMQMAMIEREGD